MYKKLIVISFIFLLYGYFSVNTFAEKIDLVCSDCHIMHGMEEGQITGPYPTLLRAETINTLCLSCHDGSDVLAPNVTNYNSSLAAGFFDAVGYPSENSHDLGTGFSPAPGGSDSMALTCTTCHDPHTNNNYRDLKPDTIGSGSNLDIAINAEASGYGEDNVRYIDGISNWCADCHPDFYNSGDFSNNNHPVDTAFGNSLIVDYSHYSSITNQMPVEDTDGIANNADEVVCITCHKAHGSSYPNTLFFKSDPGREKITIECHQCHPDPVFQNTIHGDYNKGAQRPGSDEMKGICRACHTMHKAAGENLLYINGTPSEYYNNLCYDCHSNSLRTYIGRSDYNESIHAVSNNVSDGKHMAGQCLNCHNPHGVDDGTLTDTPIPDLTKAKQEELCYICHKSGGVNSATAIDIYGKFKDTSNHHPVSDTDQSDGLRTIECVSCHNPHLADQLNNSIDSSNIVYPDNTNQKWYIQTDVNAPDYTTNGIYRFCEKCHINNGTTQPLSANGTTIPYTIKMYPSEVNFNYFNSSTYNAGNGEKHGGEAGTGDTAFFNAATGTTITYNADYPPMPCTDCHDSHGSDNRWQIKDFVNGITESYDMNTVSGQKIFCNACHGLGEGAVRNQLCTDCHYHTNEF